MSDDNEKHEKEREKKDKPPIAASMRDFHVFVAAVVGFLAPARPGAVKQLESYPAPVGDAPEALAGVLPAFSPPGGGRPILQLDAPGCQRPRRLTNRRRQPATSATRRTTAQRSAAFSCCSRAAPWLPSHRPPPRLCLRRLVHSAGTAAHRTAMKCPRLPQFQSEC